MLPIHHFSTSVVREIVRRQPSSKEKTQFVWQLAVGPALARATTVELLGTTLVVRADRRWVFELDRARSLIFARLQHLLGSETVAALEFHEQSTTPDTAR